MAPDANDGIALGPNSAAKPDGATSSRPTPKRNPAALASNKKPRKRQRTKETASINEPPRSRSRVYVFGSGENGELGLGVKRHDGKSPENATRPRLNHLLDPSTVGVVQVAAGGMHCASLTESGKVLTWGVNDSKALGRDTTWAPPSDSEDDEDGNETSELNPFESTPTVVDNLQHLGTIVQVAGTDNATFLLTASGLVYGWGTFFGDDGAFGFLKDGFKNASRPTYEEKFATSATLVPNLRNVKELAAGVNHVLALTHTGDVYSWGSGHQAELGRRILPRRPYEALQPERVPLPKHRVTRVYAGFNHNFAIDDKGRVFSGGLNNFGQTGQPTGDDNLRVTMPTLVQALDGISISHMAGGFHHSLAATQDGCVLAWGRCDDGQMGVDLSGISKNDVLFDSRGQPRIVAKPTTVPGVERATFVAAGIDNSLALNADGHGFSWGFSDSYRTGLATDDPVDRPSLLKGKGLGVLTFAACGGRFSIVTGPQDSP